MLSFLINRPIGVLVSFFAAVTVGFILFLKIPVSLLPNIPIPEIVVNISYANASPTEVEKIVVKPIRQSLLQLNNLQNIESRSRLGACTILLRFDYGTNIDLAAIETNEKIDQIISQLPRDLERPIVTKANASDIPVCYLNILEKKDTQRLDLALSEWTQNILVRRIEQLSEVAFVDISGYLHPQISIIPDETALRKYGLDVTDIERILTERNVKPVQFVFKDGHYQYHVEMRSHLENVSDIKAIYFNIGNHLITMADVAEVILLPEKRKGKHLYNGQEAISLSIHKKNEAQIFSLISSISELIDELKKEEPTLSFKLTNNQSHLLRISIDGLKAALIFGAFSSMLILFIFYQQWRFALLIIFTVPISFFITIIGLNLLGININIISLACLLYTSPSPRDRTRSRMPSSA